MKFTVTFDTLPSVTHEDMQNALQMLLDEFFHDCPYLISSKVKVEPVPLKTT